MSRVGIVGVTGYTGMELARIMEGHPGVQLSYATSRQRAGETLGSVHPQFTGPQSDLQILDFDPQTAAASAEIIFVCLPHGSAMEAVSGLYRKGARVIDLSADMRLPQRDLYEQWYGPHSCPELLELAVPGFPERHRSAIAGAEIVANPGCYPTSIFLALLPALVKGIITTDSIIADSKSGVSGAGREPKSALHFPEVEGNFSAYSIAGTHRHTAEMENALSEAGGASIRITFTPHLLPVSRGILSTVYASKDGDLDTDDVVGIYRQHYRNEPFVRVFSESEGLPDIKSVRGTNMCHVAPRVDQRTGRLVVVSCIDNLVKGAAGQAVQNMNIMCGFQETTGLARIPALP